MKPCDAVEGLPCSGSLGSCFGRPYWGGKPFSDESGKANKHKRRVAKDALEACPWVAQVCAWWELSEALLGPSWTPGQRAAFDAEIRSEGYKPHFRGKLEDQPEKFTEEVSE